jgi:hypothetical protein
MGDFEVSLTPKNWKEFQHYTDRKPAWIKLHRALLDDYQFACLPVASRALAPCLWLLASEYKDGEITASLEEIAFRLRMTAGELSDALHPLVKSGFFTVASDALADCYQDACLEKEKEKEKEVEGANAPPPQKRSKVERKNATRIPSDFEPDWEAATRAQLSRTEAVREFEKFKNWSSAKGQTYVDWNGAWRNWCIKAAEYMGKPPPGDAKPVMLTITPSDRSWNAWKSHFRDAGQNGRAAIMDKCASDGKPFTVQSEWPPGSGMSTMAQTLKVHEAKFQP